MKKKDKAEIEQIQLEYLEKAFGVFLCSYMKGQEVNQESVEKALRMWKIHGKVPLFTDGSEQIDKLEKKVQEKEDEIDGLEYDIRELEDENDSLRCDIRNDQSTYEMLYNRLYDKGIPKKSLEGNDLVEVMNALGVNFSL